jgi:hypothetical protein
MTALVEFLTEEAVVGTATIDNGQITKTTGEGDILIETRIYPPDNRSRTLTPFDGQDYLRAIPYIFNGARLRARVSETTAPVRKPKRKRPKVSPVEQEALRVEAEDKVRRYLGMSTDGTLPEMVVYRGLDQELPDEEVVGSIFSDPNEVQASEFPVEARLLVAIHVKEGQKGRKNGRVTTLPAGTKFRVTGRTRTTLDVEIVE